MSIPVIDLELTVVKADGLAAKDTNLFGMKTKSDPYVEVRLCPHGLNDTSATKLLVGKTVPKMKTLAPRWDQTFSISLPRSDFNDIAMFELTIMDYDRWDEDDLMGVVPVNIPISRPGTSTKWYGVPATSAFGEEATGRIQCTLKHYSGSKTPEELQAAAQNRSLVEKTDVAAPEKEDQDSGNKEEFVELKLVVKKADGLAAMDSNIIGRKTKSDPYIEVRLCPEGPSGFDKKIFLGKTKTQLKTLAPKYNETFTATLPKKAFSETAMLELTIMDYDETNEDDLMGVVPIPVPFGGVTNLFVPFGGTTNSTKWYEVPKDSAEGGVGSGRVQCTLMHTKVMGNPNTQVKEVTDRLKAAFSAKKAPVKPAPALTVVSDSSESGSNKGEVEEEEAQERSPQQRTRSRRLDNSTLRQSRHGRQQARSTSPLDNNNTLRQSRHGRRSVSPMPGIKRSSTEGPNRLGRSISPMRSSTGRGSPKRMPIKRSITGDGTRMRRSDTGDRMKRRPGSREDGRLKRTSSTDERREDDRFKRSSSTDGRSSSRDGANRVSSSSGRGSDLARRSRGDDDDEHGDDAIQRTSTRSSKSGSRPSTRESNRAKSRELSPKRISSSRRAPNGEEERARPKRSPSTRNRRPMPGEDEERPKRSSGSRPRSSRN